MRDPIRMVESGELTAVEFELLDSARREEPDERAKALLLAGLGGVSLMPLAQLSTHPSAVVALPSWSKVALLRWISGIGLGGAVAAGWLAFRPPGEEPLPCVEGKSCAALEVGPAAPIEPAGTLPPAPPAVQAEPPAAAEQSAVQPAKVVGAPAPQTRRAPDTRAASSLSLTQEVAALEPARVALRAGDAELTLRVLSRYQARFPSGVLRPEAEALRAQARALKSR